MSGTPFLCFFFFLETSDMMILLSDFHPETWNPMWSGTQFLVTFLLCTKRVIIFLLMLLNPVSSILTGLYSFMVSDGA
jgi:hypothetical protein